MLDRVSPGSEPNSESFASSAQNPPIRDYKSRVGVLIRTTILGVIALGVVAFLAYQALAPSPAPTRAEAPATSSPQTVPLPGAPASSLAGGGSSAPKASTAP